MTHQTKEYEEIIRTAGYRLTKQRILILDAVCECGGHTTLAEVFARVRAQDSIINLSTVYRTLRLFVELRLVVAANTGSGDTWYEIAHAEHHHHLVCRKCGQEQVINDTALLKFYDAVWSQNQFAIETDHLMFFGLCVDCQRT